MKCGSLGGRAAFLDPSRAWEAAPAASSYHSGPDSPEQRGGKGGGSQPPIRAIGSIVVYVFPIVAEQLDGQ
jgi:hypothetical protein